MWVSPSLCSNLPPQSCHQVYLLCKLNNQQSPNTLSPKLPAILAALFTLFPIHLSHVNTQHPSKNSAQAETCHVLAGSEEKKKTKTTKQINITKFWEQYMSWQHAVNMLIFSSSLGVPLRADCALCPISPICHCHADMSLINSWAQHLH